MIASGFGEWVPEGAWDFNEKVATHKPVYGSPLAAVGYLALKFYQNEIHPLRESAARCPFYPTCSRFALESLSLYGAFWGTLMTLDRLLIREHQGLEKEYEMIEIGPDRRFFDPVAKNFIFLKRL
ncbi:MAG: membrane protein insertion efficiency factor YidD [Spirochaetia bacterium]|nr:membrane protein insertion efficiency factor YidD [Spirochaetia bacterium]